MLKILPVFLLFHSCEQVSRKASIEEIQKTILTDLNPENPTEVPRRTFEQELMGLINDHRLEQGLPPLIKEEELSYIALKHSQNMALNRVPFGHSGFSERCTESRLVLGGGNWCAENVAMGYETPKSVFDGWINSAGHRANIESSKATVTGIGYATNSKGTFYWTQIFLEY